MIGGVANKGSVIDPEGDPVILPLSFQAASWNREMPRRIDEVVSMESTGTESGREPRFC